MPHKSEMAGPLNRGDYNKQALSFTLLCIWEVLPKTYSQFQNSQEFAVGVGVILDTLANSNGSHADGVFISAL